MSYSLLTQQLPFTPGKMSQLLGNKKMDKARVLLVEDIPMIQKLHLQFLQELNCDADLAATGEEALMSYQKDKYDLIFLDLGLPDFNGIEICKFIRKQNDLIPIIVLTSQGIEVKNPCMRAGVNHFVQKPTDLQTLRDLLVRWVSIAKE